MGSSNAPLSHGHLEPCREQDASYPRVACASAFSHGTVPVHILVVDGVYHFACREKNLTCWFFYDVPSAGAHALTQPASLLLYSSLFTPESPPLLCEEMRNSCFSISLPSVPRQASSFCPIIDSLLTLSSLIFFPKSSTLPWGAFAAHALPQAPSDSSLMRQSFVPPTTRQPRRSWLSAPSGSGSHETKLCRAPSLDLCDSSSTHSSRNRLQRAWRTCGANLEGNVNGRARMVG